MMINCKLKNKYLQLIRFDKPIGTLLLLWPTFWAIIIASNFKPDIINIVIFGLGVFLTRSAGCVFNDIFDSDIDKYVIRTKDRPITNGSITKTHALIIAIILSFCAFIPCLIFFNIDAILISILAGIIYILYPLCKRFFILPQLCLGIAFSMGIIIAFIQIKQQITIITIILFIANIFWVLGYDTIYALSDIIDDKKINLKSTAITMGNHVNLFITICYSIFIALMILLGVSLELSSLYFFACSISAGILCYQIIWLYYLKVNNNIQLSLNNMLYIKLFKLNNWIGLLISLGILL